jgi:hypothetical protein
MATIRYAVQSSRREQMKRELIGLVIGTTLLMAGMAFLFSQTLVADGAASSNATETASKPTVVATPTVLADATTLAMAKADTPAPASLDVTATNATVTPLKTPEQSTKIMPETKVAEPVAAMDNKTAAEPVADAAATPAGSTGWIYGGQFANGKWKEQGLKIGAELPVTGNKYPLSWGATVREHPPGKRSEGSGKLGKTLGNLAAGSEVEIVQVKKSGGKGHVWLEIKYQ